jgi:hypothetical protein
MIGVVVVAHCEAAGAVLGFVTYKLCVWWAQRPVKKVTK